MTSGLNIAGQNSSELAGLVTKTETGQIEFTAEGKEKANEMINGQITKLFDKAMRPFSNQLTQIIKKNPNDEDAKKELLALCNGLDQTKPVDETGLTTVQGLVKEAKKRKAVILNNELAGQTAELENNRPALLNKVLTVCTKHYKQKEFDEEFMRRISHVARIPIFALGAAFQLTKTLFKAIFLSVPVEIIDYVAHTNYGTVAGFSGVKTDLQATVGLATKILGCFHPKKGESLFKSCKIIYNVTTWEKDIHLGLYGALPPPAGHQVPTFWELFAKRWHKTFSF